MTSTSLPGIREGDQRLEPVLTYAGTLGFRGIDLLLEGTHYPTRAMYRDDLESFFYVLYYIQVHYRDGRRLPIHDATRWWKVVNDNIEGLGEEKLGWLISRPVPDSPLSPDWLVPLHNLLKHAYNARGDFHKSTIPHGNSHHISDNDVDDDIDDSDDSYGINDPYVDRVGAEHEHVDKDVYPGRNLAGLKEWGPLQEETLDGRFTFDALMNIIG